MRKAIVIQFLLVACSLVVLFYVVFHDSSYIEVPTEIRIRTGGEASALEPVERNDSGAGESRNTQTDGASAGGSGQEETGQSAQPQNRPPVDGMVRRAGETETSYSNQENQNEQDRQAETLYR